MDSVQKASAGMNLRLVSRCPAGPSPTGGSIHLNQERLELAAGRVDIVDKGSGHQCGHIRHEVAERGVKDQPVDGLVEGLGEGEGGDDEDGAYERKHGACPLDDADDVDLGRREARIVHGCVGARTRRKGSLGGWKEGARGRELGSQSRPRDGCHGRASEDVGQSCRPERDIRARR